MRRGYRNRWVKDQSPQSDGLVSVSTLDKTTNYADTTALANRKVHSSTLTALARAGWVPRLSALTPLATPPIPPNRVRPTGQDLPTPLRKSGRLGF